MRARARRETEIDTRPENETEDEKREEARLVVIAHRMAFGVVDVVRLRRMVHGRASVFS